MKKIAIFFFATIITYIGMSQDTIYVEGIYIQRFLKSETKFRIENKILRDKGESFATMIDYRLDKFFFSIKVSHRITLMDETDIVPALGNQNSYKNLEVFQLPSGWTIDDTSTDTDFPQKKISGDLKQYFFSTNDTLFLYKAFKIYGTAVRYTVNNDYLIPTRDRDLHLMGINSTLISRGIPYFFLYSFFRIDAVEINYQLPGFYLWSEEDP